MTEQTIERGRIGRDPQTLIHGSRKRAKRRLKALGAELRAAQRRRYPSLVDRVLAKTRLHKRLDELGETLATLRRIEQKLAEND